MFEKEAEEYANGKGHEHYNYLFEENAGSPVDFARFCFQDGAEFGYNKANEEHEGKCKTAYIKGIRTMANALKDYDRTDGAWTDYFEHKVEEVLKRLLKEIE
ncbi:MAG: hypothetical protein J6W16_06715 [Methanobrevibacter sp.]|nr:hypothetical protein [Methanobrevibacter sp.]MBP5785255.1 hypothetical protein [Methanobrevibacter sp.]